MLPLDKCVCVILWCRKSAVLLILRSIVTLASVWRMSEVLNYKPSARVLGLILHSNKVLPLSNFSCMCCLFVYSFFGLEPNETADLHFSNRP